MPAMRNEDLYIGLMSGTSADGIDAALVQAGERNCRILATAMTPLPDDVRRDLLALCQPGENELDRAGVLHRRLGEVFAGAVERLLETAGIEASRISAIGSHGQTVRHRPGPEGFSVQLGSPDVIAVRTGIPVVADFRNRDMVLGGEGAPLVPRFHQCLFARAGERRAVLNIGGMANVTLLDGERLAAGFDTGPGNVLLDEWCRRHTGNAYDADGAWGGAGSVLPALLERLLAEPYFSLLPPKSTGREQFNGNWLTQHLDGDERPEDIQATLTELTAASVALALADFAPDRLLVCGGGVHNGLLMERLAVHLPDADIVPTDRESGLDPDWVEAAAFAWLARARLAGETGNAPEVSGASAPAVLGALYAP